MKLLKDNKFLFWVFVGTFLFFFIPRFFYIHLGLPHYSIDENDIVEFAIGYFGGDLNPYWYKYGPLYSYLLAIIYSVQSWFFEGNLDQHAEYYFSNSSLFYYSARFLNSVIHIALAFMAFAITHKFISKKTAPLVLVIALLPFSDLLTGYTIRVDSLLALNLIIALYFSLHFLTSNKLKWFVLTGLFIGFAFGTKPLPSLMILPTVYLSWILATINKKITFGNAIVKSILEYRLYVLVLFILVGLFISHPYAIINFKEFFNEQLNVIKDDSSFGWEKGYVVSRFFPIIGLPFVLISGIAVLLTFYYSFSSKKWAPFLLASFVLVFWGAFANAPAREYFYVPIIPVLCILIGYLFNKYTTNFKYIKLVSLVLILILGFVPIKTTLLSYSQYGLNLQKLKDTQSLKAEKWVYENIPPSSKIFYYGYYVNLPRLIDPDINEQSRYGEYFMYERYKNQYLSQRFVNFFNNYLNSRKPTYDLVYGLNFNTPQGNKSYYTRYEMEDNEEYLYQILQQMQVPYVITNYDLNKYPEFKEKQIWSYGPNGTLYIYKIL